MNYLRHYPFDNIANFRDLGGYPAGKEGMTRWGVFFRAARLTTATPAELDAIKALGIRTVLDLRMDEEIRTRPDQGMDDADLGWQHITLMDNVQFDGADVDDMPDEVPPMSTLYAYMLEHSKPLFRNLFETLAERVQHGAVLFHCTAGKDRTGLTAMFLMAICGADELDMIAEYQVSRTYNLRFMPKDTTGSDPSNLQETLQLLGEQYGGPVAYLRAIGVTEETLTTLRNALYAPLD